MYDKRDERWMQLCRLASVEHDPDKLIELIREINRLLETKRAMFRFPMKKGTD
jgi:hypothetical protein